MDFFTSGFDAGRDFFSPCKWVCFEYIRQDRDWVDTFEISYRPARFIRLFPNRSFTIKDVLDCRRKFTEFDRSLNSQIAHCPKPNSVNETGKIKNLKDEDEAS